MSAQDGTPILITLVVNLQQFVRVRYEDIKKFVTGRVVNVAKGFRNFMQQYNVS